jgi:hypothetical protein
MPHRRRNEAGRIDWMMASLLRLSNFRDYHPDMAGMMQYLFFVFFFFFFFFFFSGRH